MDWTRVERWLVVLIALHSYAVGIVLLVLPRWAMAFAGWGRAEPLFFVRQGGAFHLVVATAYLVEHFRHREITLLLIAKSLATVFLVLEWRFGADPAWAVPFSAAGDAAMGCAAFIVHRRAVAAGSTVPGGAPRETARRGGGR